LNSVNPKKGLGQLNAPPMNVQRLEEKKGEGGGLTANTSTKPGSTSDARRWERKKKKEKKRWSGRRRGGKGKKKKVRGPSLALLLKKRGALLLIDRRGKKTPFPNKIEERLVFVSNPVFFAEREGGKAADMDCPWDKGSLIQKMEEVGSLAFCKGRGGRVTPLPGRVGKKEKSKEFK